MPRLINKTKTYRNQIPFDKIPTVCGPIYGTSLEKYHVNEYSAILDTVYEMANEIAESNGISHFSAVRMVIQESPEFKILPTHQKLIVSMLDDREN